MAKVNKFKVVDIPKKFIEINYLKVSRLAVERVLRRNKSNKKVVLIGWFGAFNLGDEMMLDVTLSVMEKRGHDITLLVHNKNEKTLHRYKKYKIVARRPLKDEVIEKIVNENDALFVNGGAMIDDRYYEDPNSLARDIARIAKAFLLKGKKVVVYGVSSNMNIENEQLINDYKYIIDNATYFSVRDELSLKELANFVNVNKIKLVHDIEFADKVLSSKVSSRKKQDIIAVTAIFDNNTIDDVKLFFDKLIKTTRSSIRLILFYDENDNDAKMTEDLKKFLKLKRFTIKEISSPTNSIDLYRALEDVDMYVSMRYHGILFANAIGKRVISLEYDKHPHYHNKNTYLREHYGFSNSTLKLSEVKDLSAEELTQILDTTSPSLVNIKKVNIEAASDLSYAINLI